MNVEILPSKLLGKLEAPSSKSMCHRLLTACIFNEYDIKIHTNCFSDDISATCSCLNLLGKRAIYNDKEGYIGIKKGVCEKKSHLFANESGTTARFMLPCASAVLESFSLDGSGRLLNRPFSHLCGEMSKNGVEFDSYCLPMNCNGRLHNGIYELPGNISTQFISGLLFALPTLDGDSEIRITTKIEGFPYIQMTLDVLKDFGVNVDFKNNCFYIKGNQKYSCSKDIVCEADWSNSAFFVVANNLGSNIELTNLNFGSSQGDMKIIDLCKNICDTDASDIPDLVPILSVLYAVSGKKVTIYNAGRLRLKESDRIDTTCNMLKSLGADVEQTSDTIVIHGKDYLNGGVVDSYNDHRIAMSAAIASTMCKNKVVIKNAQAVKKSYPGFFDDFKSLGGIVNVI